MHLSHFQNESYIPQLFTTSVLMGWWSGIGMASSFSGWMNDTYIVLLLLNYSENSPNRGYITIMPFCLSKIVSPRPLLMILNKGSGTENISLRTKIFRLP